MIATLPLSSGTMSTSTAKNTTMVYSMLDWPSCRAAPGNQRPGLRDLTIFIRFTLLRPVHDVDQHAGEFAGAREAQGRFGRAALQGHDPHVAVADRHPVVPEDGPAVRGHHAAVETRVGVGRKLVSKEQRTAALARIEMIDIVDD